ncbi:MAG: TVP38/TMEM64 family protein [Spartobacteria bacterium]|nr:TVP38/TMEM64 family protein [Spartobacteria bacterium]
MEEFIEIAETIETSEEVSLRKPLIKAIVVLVVLLTALVAVYSSPLVSYLKQMTAIQGELDKLGWAAPLIFMLATAALIAIGVPRLPLCTIGGVVFGFWLGLLLSQLGNLIGAYATFEFVRWGGREFVIRKWPKVDRLSHIFHKMGIPAVIAARQLPVGGVLINVVLGLTPVKHRDFLLGTLLGNLPEAIPFTLFGSGMIYASRTKGIASIVFAVAMLAFIWYFAAKHAQKVKLLMKSEATSLNAAPQQAPNERVEG